MPYHQGMNKLRLFFEGGALSVSDFARSLNVSVPTIAQWCNGTRPVPIARCLAIERLTHGKVSRRDLRPDDWMHIWPDLEAPANQAQAAINSEAKEGAHA